MDTNINRYLVVAWDNYYPDGCLNNIRAAFATRESAEALANALQSRRVYDRVMVHDAHNMPVTTPANEAVLMKELGLDDCPHCTT